MRAEGLVVAYENGPAVVRGAEIRLRPGRFVALVGDNGSGKTSLLRAVAGLLSPQAGSVEVGGHPVDSAEVRQVLSFVGDTPVFYDGLSIGENLDFIARLHGVASRREQPVVGTLGVTGLLEQLPGRLSRGQRQRSSLVMGLARPWRVAVLDEPLSGLDPGSRDRLIQVVRDYCRSGRAVLASTHDRALAQAADVVMTMVDGALVDPTGPALTPV